MNKQEALKILKDKLFYNEETSLEVRPDGVELIKRGIVDDLALEAIKVLENAEKTVDEILDWKDGDIYKWSGMQYKVEEGTLYVSNSGEYWQVSTYNNLNDDGKMAKIIKKESIKNRSIYGILGWKEGDVYKWKDMKYKLEDGILYVSDLDEECWIESIYNDLFSHKHRVFIIKDEAVKVKEKAYYVKDQYSFNKLMEELEEQGYVWRDGGKLTKEVELCFSNFIFVNSGKYITKDPFLRGMCDFEREYGNRYELIEYYKEPRLKAWYVDDKYSWDCLMKELEEQGYRFSLWGEPTQNAYKKRYNCVAEDKKKDLKYRDFEKMKKEDYEIIEYKKEPPKFYAKIKGWKLTNDGDCYWHKDENAIHGIYPWSREEASIYTKKEWAELGITKENADFERI